MDDDNPIKIDFWYRTGYHNGHDWTGPYLLWTPDDFLMAWRGEMRSENREAFYRGFADGRAKLVEENQP